MAPENPTNETTEENRYLDIGISFARQWKSWLIAIACIAIAVFALGGGDEAPPGYPHFFFTFGALSILYGLERTEGFPNPISRVWH